MQMRARNDIHGFVKHASMFFLKCSALHASECLAIVLQKSFVCAFRIDARHVRQVSAAHAAGFSPTNQDIPASVFSKKGSIPSSFSLPLRLLGAPWRGSTAALDSLWVVLLDCAWGFFRHSFRMFL